MVPIWRKNKNELTQEDYSNFYKEKHYGFDTPLKHIHLSVDGTVSYLSLIHILMNEITSEVDGEIVEALRTDEEIVEFGICLLYTSNNTKLATSFGSPIFFIGILLIIST